MKLLRLAEWGAWPSKSARSELELWGNLLTGREKDQELDLERICLMSMV
jgi:hypothetical protein